MKAQDDLHSDRIILVLYLLHQCRAYFWLMRRGRHMITIFEPVPSLHKWWPILYYPDSFHPFISRYSLASNSWTQNMSRLCSVVSLSKVGCGWTRSSIRSVSVWQRWTRLFDWVIVWCERRYDQQGRFRFVWHGQWPMWWNETRNVSRGQQLGNSPTGLHWTKTMFYSSHRRLVWEILVS